MRRAKTGKWWVCSAVLISSLSVAVMVRPLRAAAFNDAPGVTVHRPEAPLIHRPPVSYPRHAIADRVAGTVIVTARLGTDGSVVDASVESGPDELGKAALQSVLQWHFDQAAANTTQHVTIDFVLPAGNERTIEPTATPSSLEAPAGEAKTIHSIEFAGLSDDAEARLRAALPLHEGDSMGQANWNALTSAVRAFDSHLMVSVTDSQSGLKILVRPKWRVAGPVQQLRLIRQVAPVYPRDAKKAGIEGTVRISARIGKDGHMAALSVISGPPELAGAALDAARKWVYERPVLNGQPVQVLTTLEINFRLSR